MKKILIYRWKAYNYRDITGAFNRAGFEIDEISQKLMNYDIDPEFEQVLREKILSDSYEFVFTVNYFALIAEVCHDIGIPYVTWSCDNPLISMYHQSVFYDTNRIFSFDFTGFSEFKSMGVKNIFYLPLASDPDRMKAALSRPGDFKRGRDKITFIGRLYERNSYDSIRKKLPDYLAGYFDAAVNAQSDLYGNNIFSDIMTSDILTELMKYIDFKKSERSLSDLGLVFSTTALGFKTARVQRIRALKRLSLKFPVTVYTNSSTEEIPLADAPGPVDYWSELPHIYKDSIINLNMTIPNIKSGIPLRVWDIVSTGGFVLSNYQAELPEYFKAGQDMDWFSCEDELVEKCAFYMAHPDICRKIGARAAEKAGENTIDDRIREILKHI